MNNNKNTPEIRAFLESGGKVKKYNNEGRLVGIETKDGIRAPDKEDFEEEGAIPVKDLSTGIVHYAKKIKETALYVSIKIGGSTVKFNKLNGTCRTKFFVGKYEIDIKDGCKN